MNREQNSNDQIANEIFESENQPTEEFVLSEFLLRRRQGNSKTKRKLKVSRVKGRFSKSNY